MRTDDVADALGKSKRVCVATACAVFEASASAVGETCFDRDDAFAGATILDGASTGGVVADAASDAGVPRGCGVGCEEQAAGCDGVVQVIDGDAGFDVDGFC